MISCVIPAGANRPELLERARESLGLLPHHETIMIPDAPSCGAGWNTGAALSSGDYVWLLADDVELRDTRQLGWALGACDEGYIICPAIYWGETNQHGYPAGALQGAGGFGRNFASGAVADNCIFPLMSRATWLELAQVPPLNHYCDVYVTSWARERDRGPVVVRGLSLTHAIVSPDTDGEHEAYLAWLAEQER